MCLSGCALLGGWSVCFIGELPLEGTCVLVEEPYWRSVLIGVLCIKQIFFLCSSIFSQGTVFRAIIYLYIYIYMGQCPAESPFWLVFQVFKFFDFP